MLRDRYRSVRVLTAKLAEPLTDEDCVVQSMGDASPTKWHLAHSTWFFEHFVLRTAAPGYRSFRDTYTFLFNSYYDAVGDRHSRHERGLLTRPSRDEVMAYRTYVDAAMIEILSMDLDRDLAFLVNLGLHHEQQHQELMLTDIKHAFSCNPLLPRYRDEWPGIPESSRDTSVPSPSSPVWISFAGGLVSIGHDAESGEFAFDNESPRHRVFLEPFALRSTPVTNAEYLEFIRDGGYEKPALWLSDGHRVAREHGWKAPLYWRDEEGEREPSVFTLRGLQRVDLAAPVCHVSYYEADAYARWAGARLATEAEWEVAGEAVPLEGNFVESGRLEPTRARVRHEVSPLSLFGDVWEWTQSSYVAYPGFAPFHGDVGEYNGKFMCNQMVLRGGSCVTSSSHVRRTYRNFFPPEARWQFSGIRLARPA